MSPRTRLLVALASTALIGYIAVGSLLGRVLGDTSYGQLAVFNEVVRLVLDAYVEPVNLDRAMAGANLGMLDALDGDSAYLAPDEFKLFQQPAREADAEVGLLLTRRFSFLMVVGARPGSPARKAGLRPGDILKTLDGRHSRSIAVPTAERLLRGAPGSVVKLTILRAGTDPFDVSLVRERLAPAAPKGRMLEAGIGYLELAELPARASEEARAQLDALKRAGARQLVLDLRGSSWGAPSEAPRIAELFMKGGVVARLKSRRGEDQLLQADPGRTQWDQPLAVLIDSGTAGAGEIVASALRESGRATLVGERSFGRAAVQRAVPLPEGGLVLTTAKYANAKGEPIHGKGVEPSVVVETAEPSEDEPAAPADPVLDKALELLKAGEKKAA